MFSFRGHRYHLIVVIIKFLPAATGFTSNGCAKKHLGIIQCSVPAFLLVRFDGESPSLGHTLEKHSKFAIGTKYNL